MFTRFKIDTVVSQHFCNQTAVQHDQLAKSIRQSSELFKTEV